MKKGVDAYLERWRQKPYPTKVLSYLSEILRADLIFCLHVLAYIRVTKNNLCASVT